VLERAKSSILTNGNFREFFLWRGEFCVFKTGIPGGPDLRSLFSYRSYFTLESPACFCCIGWEHSCVQKVIKASGLFLCNVWNGL